MKARRLPKRTWGPLAIAFIYAVFGAIWIAFSDEFVARTFRDPLTIKHMSIYKGWAYVAITALLVYLLARSMEGTLTRYVKELADANDGLRNEMDSRKHAQDSLRDTERRLRTILENIPDMMIRFDKDSRVLFANPAVSQAFGIAASELLGKTIRQIHIAGDDNQNLLLENMLHRAFDEGISNKTEIELLTTDGHRTFDILHIPERDDSGSIVSVLGIAHDVTEQKRIDRQLWESSQMFKLVLDNMPAFVFWKDRQSVYLGCNNLFAANAGLTSPEKIIGLTDLDLPWKNTEAESYRADDRMVIDSGFSKLNYEETQHTASGRTTWVRTSKIPLRNHEGAIIGVLGTFEDITEFKRAQMQREALLRELAEKNNELKSIVYISSHDLRSPIINILGFSAQLGDSARDIRTLVADQPLTSDARSRLDAIINQEMPQALGFIKNSAEKMNALVSALLKLSRIGALTMTIVQVNANELVRRLINAMQYQLRKASANVVVDSLPSCMADEIQLSQVFTNLIDNALKYTHPQRTPEIRISGRVEGKEAIYSVSDNGIGISPAYHSKVFELFHRLNPDETASGEGVGLTIVSNIITRHHGRVWLESTPGQGSTFYFSLPTA